MAKRRNRLPVQRKDTRTVRDDGRGWMTVYHGGRDYDAGWFQKDIHYHRHDAHRNWTVFACRTLIAGDMGKMSPLLMQPTETPAGVILKRIESPAFSPLFRKPNSFQTWPQFMQWWMLSKLDGNTYALKGRDNRRVTNALYVLRHDCVTPMIAPDGSVFYRLKTDELAGLPDEVVVPADEIIHDRMNCLYHPLVGLSPLYASGLAASQGLTIQEMSSRFFQNNSRPSGILSTVMEIKDAQAKQYRREWDENFGGAKVGGTAVLGNGLAYNPIAQNAVDSELTKQLGMTAEMICSTYHVPGYKVGVGVMPAYQNAEIYDQIYYDSCIQIHATDIEALFDDGLGLANAGYAFKFDLDDLLKMDSATQIEGLNKAVGGGWMAPNEARAKRNMPAVDGGDSPMMQQQQYSLAALAERDSDKPFTKPATAPAAAPPGAGNAANDDNAGEEAAAATKALADLFCRDLDYVTA